MLDDDREQTDEEFRAELREQLRARDSGPVRVAFAGGPLDGLTLAIEGTEGKADDDSWEPALPSEIVVAATYPADADPVPVWRAVYRRPWEWRLSAEWMLGGIIVYYEEEWSEQKEKES